MRNITTTLVAAIVGLSSSHVPGCHAGAQGSNNFQLTWADGDDDSVNTVCGTFIIREDSKGKEQCNKGSWWRH